MGKSNSNTSGNSNKRKFIEDRNSCNGTEGDKFQKEWKSLKKSADIVKSVDLALEVENIQTFREGTSYNNTEYSKGKEYHEKQVKRI